MGNRVGNLYILNPNNLFSTCSCFSSVCNNIKLTQKDLWNFRLGHPSYVKLQILKNELKISEIFVDSLPCIVFPLAKQEHLPFVSANSLFDCLFNLMHYDICGPFTP